MADINANVVRDTMRDGLPEKIKVTISREDGDPLFSRDQDSQVEHLSEAAPILVVLLDSGTIRTMQGDLHSALDFIEGLTLPY